MGRITNCFTEMLTLATQRGAREDRAEAQELLDLLATAKAPVPVPAHYASAPKPRKRYHRIKRVRKPREPFIK